VLLSGGLDSTTALAVARSRGLACHALTVRYGQLHQVELEAAARVAAALGAREHRVVAIDLGPIAASALTSPDIAVPKDRTLSAESLGARDIFVGVNVLDASGYPDCRPAFVRAFEALAQVATRTGGYRIQAPLIEMTKAQIIALGAQLGVDYAMTHSCYDPQGGAACGRCDACQLRRKGFVEAGVPDPTRYA
jgi:7-cyano-7-deazaguanine synthase